MAEIGDRTKKYDDMKRRVRIDRIREKYKCVNPKLKKKMPGTILNGFNAMSDSDFRRNIDSFCAILHRVKCQMVV